MSGWVCVCACVCIFFISVCLAYKKRGGWIGITRSAWVDRYYQECVGGYVLPGVRGWIGITRSAWVDRYYQECVGG